MVWRIQHVDVLFFEGTVFAVSKEPQRKTTILEEIVFPCGICPKCNPQRKGEMVQGPIKRAPFARFHVHNPAWVRYVGRSLDKPEVNSTSVVPLLGMRRACACLCVSVDAELSTAFASKAQHMSHPGLRIPITYPSIHIQLLHYAFCDMSGIHAPSWRPIPAGHARRLKRGAVRAARQSAGTARKIAYQEAGGVACP